MMTTTKRYVLFLLKPLLALALIATITGCGGETTAEAPVCAPGELQRCPCTPTTTGIQECREDRKGWGPCSGCGEAADDTGTDSETGPVQGDTDSDTGPALGECEYASCEGDACRGVDGCCDGAACSDWIFSDENEYIETYCYPMCAPESEEERCKCGDTCLEVDGLPLCVKTGGFQLENLTTTVGVDYASAGITDTGNLDMTITKGDDQIWIDDLFVFWDDWETPSGEARRDLAILGRGYVGTSSQWLLWITMPEEIYARGVGDYTNAAERTFFAEFYFGNYNASGSLSELWLEAALDMDDSTLTINQTCEPCGPATGSGPDAGVDGGAGSPGDLTDAGADGGPDTATGDGECGQCSFSFDFFWYALRAKESLTN